jgi:hypothetical protein
MPSAIPSAGASNAGGYDSGAGLNASLVGRVIEIRGIDAQRFIIPASVATTGSYSAADSLPSACGVISAAGDSEQNNLSAVQQNNSK